LISKATGKIPSKPCPQIVGLPMPSFIDAENGEREKTSKVPDVQGRNAAKGGRRKKTVIGLQDARLMRNKSASLSYLTQLKGGGVQRDFRTDINGGGQKRIQATAGAALRNYILQQQVRKQGKIEIGRPEREQKKEEKWLQKRLCREECKPCLKKKKGLKGRDRLE